ncbi:MAG TPA: CHRD domain-containing protein [Vicinamibacterales bacterium]|nr:CHRD domain-containing protein [Vicinamibacterales bacterium]
MNSTQKLPTRALALSVLAVTPLASAQEIVAGLNSYREVPSVSSRAEGHFNAVIDRRAGTITYELSYSGLQGTVQQAHIHVGQRSVNGAVSVFLCQTEASPDPTGLAPQCPQRGKVAGMVQAANMIEGPIVNQGIAPGQFNELIAAIREGVAYVNVHSTKFPGGEVRGQLRLKEP